MREVSLKGIVMIIACTDPYVSPIVENAFTPVIVVTFVTRIVYAL